MADKKESKAVETAGIEVGLIVAFIVVVAAWPAIVSFLSGLYQELGGPASLVQGGTYGAVWATYIAPVIKNILGIVIGLSFPVALFFLIGIIYCVEQIKHIRRKEEEKYAVKVEPAFIADVKGNRVLADRWERVVHLVATDNPSDWRQSIMEADIMLEDVLTTLGYQGDGIGEKLKRVEKGDMRTLQDAWDAHLVRNQIAHEGSAFPLTKYEANKVVNLYKKVFDEFYYI